MSTFNINTPIGKLNDYMDRFHTSNPVSLCKELDIPILETDLGKLFGYAIENYGVYVIGVNNKLSEHERIFTIAHELGHIISGHDFNVLALRKNTQFVTDKFEIEANNLAVHMLLKYYDVDLENRTISQLSSLTGIKEDILNTYFDTVKYF